MWQTEIFGIIYRVLHVMKEQKFVLIKHKPLINISGVNFYLFLRSYKFIFWRHLDRLGSICRWHVWYWSGLMGSSDSGTSKRYPTSITSDDPNRIFYSRALTWKFRNSRSVFANKVASTLWCLICLIVSNTRNFIQSRPR